MMLITVDLGERSYPIEIEQQILPQIGVRLSELTKGRQAAVITDDHVGSLYGQIVLDSLAKAGFETFCYTIKAGEESKTFAMSETILSQLLQHQFHRDCTIIALGGGVVGDLAGFCASIYQRGVNFIQIPTSLLAQVDSSVGGKVAVNHALGKNMIGSFYQPKAVWIDLDTLSTLPERHWRNGMAEVIKYGMIVDRDFFAFLKEHSAAINCREKTAVTEMIARCCQLKAQVVAKDEQERGLRAKLNFGHTFGHGLEIASHFDYLHGEAIAIGMVLASLFACEQKMCTQAVIDELRTLLQNFHLPVAMEKALSLDDVLAGMALDKKVTQGSWVLILPQAVGQVEIVNGITQDKVRNFLESKVKS